MERIQLCYYVCKHIQLVEHSKINNVHTVTSNGNLTMSILCPERERERDRDTNTDFVNFRAERPARGHVSNLHDRKHLKLGGGFTQRFHICFRK